MKSWEEVPDFAEAIACPRCQQRHAIADEYHDFDQDLVLCGDCGLGPLVPVGPECDDPKRIGGKWTAIRNGLLSGDLEFRAEHIALVLALATHEWVPGQWVHPGVDRLAVMAGVSPKTTKRRLGELVDRGVLLRQARKAPSGVDLSNAYCLSPLWRIVDSGGQVGGQSDPLVGGQADRGEGVRLTPEVDVDFEVRPKEKKHPKPGASARSTSSSTENINGRDLRLVDEQFTPTVIEDERFIPNGSAKCNECGTRLESFAGRLRCAFGHGVAA